MEKEMKLFPIDYSFNWSNGVELSEIKEDLEELEKLGCNHIEIETEEEWGSIYVSAYNKRYETDEEVQERKLLKAKELEEKIKRQEEYLEDVKRKYQSYLDGQ